MRLQHDLLRRYVTAYDNTVLHPLDRRLARQLHTVTDPIPLGFGLIQRLELFTHCLATAECTPPLDYARLLAPAALQPPAPEQVALLQSTDAAYLRWAVAMPEVLQRGRPRTRSACSKWFASTEFAPAQLLRRANTQHPPVTMAALWPGLVPASRHATVRVEGAYAREAWQQSLWPFLARAAAAAPSLEPWLQAFHTAYRAQYLAQWQQFLRASGRRRSGDSPGPAANWPWPCSSPMPLTSACWRWPSAQLQPLPARGVGGAGREWRGPGERRAQASLSPPGCTCCNSI